MAGASQSRSPSCTRVMALLLALAVHAQVCVLAGAHVVGGRV
jgi:hypothetical protein